MEAAHLIVNVMPTCNVMEYGREPGVSVQEKHRKYLKFLWYRDNDMSKEITEYQMRIHVFGNNPSPAIAIYGLRRAAKEGELEHGLDTQQFVERHFYMADGLISLPNEEDAISLLKRTQKALAQSNINLHKIASNSTIVMKAFPPEDLTRGIKDLDLNKETLPKQSLGLCWEMDSDTFTFQISNSEKPFTRRGVLSVVNSLGLVTPVTIIGRALLRDISQDIRDWDIPHPEAKEKEWEVWKNSLKDRSRPGLTTTAIGAVDLQGAGGNWATVGRRSRGGRRVHRQREKRKGKSVGLRIGTLNVGTMTRKGRELADMMERKKVDILCVQETRWKGSKARSIGAGFKLFYYGVNSKRNGVGVVLKEEFVRNVLEVKRVSDRVMSLKLEIEGVMLNVVSGYAPQVGCELEEKERFWSELDEMESIPTGERVVIGADFNGHVGEGNRGDEEVMGKFGVKERNLEGQMVVDFAKRMDMVVVNTYFQKREEHRVTYKSGGRRTQVDYIYVEEAI
ncbi:hypothetical protein QTP86_010804 [Hemibagrus guttatus]|nr:hypothetical protein QTP86_010804 [Hemibagrus guttatus]